MALSRLQEEAARYYDELADLRKAMKAAPQAERGKGKRGKLKESEPW